MQVTSCDVDDRYFNRNGRCFIVSRESASGAQHANACPARPPLSLVCRPAPFTAYLTRSDGLHSAFKFITSQLEIIVGIFQEKRRCRVCSVFLLEDIFRRTASLCTPTSQLAGPEILCLKVAICRSARALRSLLRLVDRSARVFYSRRKPWAAFDGTTTVAEMRASSRSS